MFHQLLTPVAGNLLLSFLAAAVPIAVVLVLLGLLRRPAWQASLAGLVAGLLVATLVWQFPPALALSSVAAGAVFAVWPVMWIVVNALLLYNIAVVSGRFDAFRDWVLDHLPNDRRVVLVVIGFCFGCLLEGISGFGTPVAITSALLIMVGFPPLEALTFTLIFNTAPVAFGALGAPVTVLGQVTGLNPVRLGAMIGRQLPFMAMLLPFYVMAVYGGLRSIKALWPMLLVAGGSFAFGQFVSSNFLDYALTDVLSSLISLVVTLLFLQVWHPAADVQFSVSNRMPQPVGADVAIGAAIARGPRGDVPAWQGWIPWVVVSVVVIAWTHLKLFAIGQQMIPWPGLHNLVSITLYHDKPYAATWVFQPLATGTAILLSAVITAALVGVGPGRFLQCVGATWRQSRIAILTVALIVALAYLMNYSGLTYTLGLGVASMGVVFPLVSPFLGWVAVFLSGSDTSGNALFGNLQVVAANQLGLNPVLIAATNSSGGVMGKMISPQNIATGVSVTDLKGQEGLVFARTFKHSIVLTLLLGGLVVLQQYVVPWMILTPPTFDAAFQARLLELFRWRRDVRHFRAEPVPPSVVEHLLEVACLAPSVGLSQPWRFVMVDAPARRQAVREDFTRCNAAALSSQHPDRAAEYARLKLAGLDEAPCHFAVFADPNPAEGGGLGRRTMPETTTYSAIMAVHTLWLAARAEGLGLGWVSIIDPAAIARILDVPSDWTFIGYFCLGYPQADHDSPELERLAWGQRRPLVDFITRR